MNKKIKLSNVKSNMYEVLCVVLLGIIVYLLFQESESKSPVHLNRRADIERRAVTKDAMSDARGGGVKKKVARHIVIHTNQSAYKIDDIHFNLSLLFHL